MTVTVEIEFTHRDRHPDRTFVIHFAECIVEADTEREGVLIAHDITTAILPRDSMVTAARVIDIDNI